MHLSKTGVRISAILAAGILAAGLSGDYSFAAAPETTVEEAEDVYEGASVSVPEDGREGSAETDSASDDTNSAEAAESAASKMETPESTGSITDAVESASSEEETAESAAADTDSTESGGGFTDAGRPVKIYDPAIETEAGDEDDLAGAAALNTSTWKKYSLTDSQLLGLTRLCYQEQGSLAGAAAEASLMANLLELYHTGSYGTDGTALYNYVRNGKWFARAAHFMDEGKLPSNGTDYIKVVKEVLVNGKRTLPLYIDEHDCKSDIKSVTGTATDGTYIAGETVICNKFSSVYTFYCYPARGSDPFGYTARAMERTGGTTPAVYKLDTKTLTMSLVKDGLTTLYRLYNKNTGEHFFTASTSERDGLRKIGWTYEGVAWRSPSKGKNVYRLYNPNTGDHHYTPSVSEKNYLVKIGWNYEGVGWKSCTAQEVALFRLYNPNETVGAHHYTTSADERDYLVKLGWIYEGIGWYACE